MILFSLFFLFTPPVIATTHHGECKIHFRAALTKPTKLEKVLKFSTSNSITELGQPGLTTQVKNFKVSIIPTTQFSMTIAASDKTIFKGLYDIESPNRHSQGFTGLHYLYDSSGQELQIFCKLN